MLGFSQCLMRCDEGSAGWLDPQAQAMCNEHEASMREVLVVCWTKRTLLSSLLKRNICLHLTWTKRYYNVHGAMTHLRFQYF